MKKCNPFYYIFFNLFYTKQTNSVSSLIVKAAPVIAFDLRKEENIIKICVMKIKTNEKLKKLEQYEK